MKHVVQKIMHRMRRHNRIRARVVGTPERPRLSFFKSNKHVYAQIIDDSTGTTLVGVSSHKDTSTGIVARAQQLGMAIAEKAQEKGIKQVVLDRGGFKYTGAVKVFAESARAKGLDF